MDNSKYYVLEGVEGYPEPLTDLEEKDPMTEFEREDEINEFIKKAVEESSLIPHAQPNLFPPETSPSTEEPTIEFNFDLPS